MTLAERIRLGVMLREQGFFAFFVDEKSCALGAAIEASGEAYDERLRDHPIFYEQAQETTCPACTVTVTLGLARMIVHLNDRHKWAREAIAVQVEVWEEEFQRAADANSTEVQRKTSEDRHVLVMDRPH